MVAVTEALMGQIYLVTIVALAVSRVRPGPGTRLRTLGEEATEGSGEGSPTRDDGGDG
jgi:hypothetical protein